MLAKSSLVVKFYTSYIFHWVTLHKFQAPKGTSSYELFHKWNLNVYGSLLWDGEDTPFPSVLVFVIVSGRR